MDETQLRFLTTQALYGKDLQKRIAAIRQLMQGDLTPEDIDAISIRLDVALGCGDEYVRSAAAMLLDGLAERIPVSPSLSKELLSLSTSPQAFSREAALRAIKRVCERGSFVVPETSPPLQDRLAEARRLEGEGFILSLFDEA